MTEMALDAEADDCILNFEMFFFVVQYPRVTLTVRPGYSYYDGLFFTLRWCTGSL